VKHIAAEAKPSLSQSAAISLRELEEISYWPNSSSMAKLSARIG
jgi:hypothetical protein